MEQFHRALFTLRQLFYIPLCSRHFPKLTLRDGTLKQAQRGNFSLEPELKPVSGHIYRQNNSFSPAKIWQCLYPAGRGRHLQKHNSTSQGRLPTAPDTHTQGWLLLRTKCCSGSAHMQKSCLTLQRISSYLQSIRKTLRKRLLLLLCGWTERPWLTALLHSHCSMEKKRHTA